MDSFSRSDRLRAVWAPLCCCLPSVRLPSSPSSDSLNATSAAERAWYGQSRPSGAADTLDGDLGSSISWMGSGGGGVRPDDVLSLHEGIGGEAPRLRLRSRGGDISGGGASDGSGLTRWTLFKSWWRGGKTGGAIRLPDSDGEEDDLDAPPPPTDGHRAHARHGSESGFSLGGEDDGDADAVPLSLEDVAVPPAPAHPPAASSTPLSPVLSEGTTLVDVDARSEPDAEREERRARRRARRRAKELGITVEEFDQGAAVDPEQLVAPSSPFLDPHDVRAYHSHSGRRGSKASSHTSSASSGSRDRSHHHSERRRELSVVEEDAIDGGEDGVLSSSRRERRSRRRHDDETSSRGSGSHRGGGSSMGGSTHSHEQPALSPAHLVPLPVSPSYAPTDYAASEPSSRRSKHRSHSSISTTSTATDSTSHRSRSSRSYRSKGYPRSEALDPLDPSYAAYAASDRSALVAEPVFYPDEAGQLQPFYPVADSASGQVVFLPAATVSPGLLPPVELGAGAVAEPEAAKGSCDHIGVLPPPSPSVAEA
ncbi:hypothetical protein JCM10207_004311 [Rhodosporidiobolus poonsookiae]